MKSIILAGALCVGLLAPGLSAASPSRSIQSGTAYTPNPGSREREDICDALRNHLNRTNQFTVHYLKVQDGGRFRFAFFRGVEMLPIKGGKTKYADSQILALVYLNNAAGISGMQKGPDTKWYVAEFARLNDPDEYEAFKKNVKARIAEDGFPPDLIDPGFVD